MQTTGNFTRQERAAAESFMQRLCNLLNAEDVFGYGLNGVPKVEAAWNMTEPAGEVFLMFDDGVNLMLTVTQAPKKPPASWQKTESHRPLLVVTPLGEVFDAEDNEVAGCVNEASLTEKLGHEPSDEEVRLELDSQLAEALPADQVEFVRSVWDLQAINNDRFRVYGTIEDDGPLVYLVTEFTNWVDDEAFWDRLLRKALRLGAAINPMRESPHLDNTSKDGGITWIHGPNHGRPERQVELVWDVTDKARSEVEALCEKIAAKTDDIWEPHGVGVI